MCRFLIYKGPPMLMSDLIIKSEQSLIRQSVKALERAEPLNGDGFGVGWYAPEVDPTPCVFTSTAPAWSNRNLHRLAEKVRSECFFAHVRAATPGLWVGEANCHPFQFDHFLWMHNGAAAGFLQYRRRLRETLSDEAYNHIQGTTDSEHAFAVFLDRIGPEKAEYTLDDLREAMIATIDTMNHWSRRANVNAPSRYNFALTDGHNTIVTRYGTAPEVQMESLYVSTGERFESVDGAYRMRPANGHAEAVIVASEPLTENRADWTAVPANHMVVIPPSLNLRIEPID